MDFPFLEVGDDRYPGLDNEGLEEVERALWKSGMNLEHEILNRGVFDHSCPSWMMENYLESLHVERE